MELTIPSVEQIIGNDGGTRLEVFRRYGITCTPTDYAIMTGAHNSRNNTSTYWTRTPINFNTLNDDDIYMVTWNGELFYSHSYLTDIAVRPIIKNPTSEYKMIDDDIACYGLYPQLLEDKSISAQLESLYQTNSLDKTGKKYVSSANYIFKVNDSYDKMKHHIEYVYHNDKYIRFERKVNRCWSSLITHECDEITWIKVMPIRWLLDKQTGILISERGIASGLRFNQNRYYGIFNETTMHDFLKCMANDIEIKELKLTLKRSETDLEKLQKDRQKILTLGKKHYN